MGRQSGKDMVMASQVAAPRKADVLEGNFRDAPPSLADNGADAFDFAIVSLLAALIVAAPMAMGSVAVWARMAIFCSAVLLVLLWFLQGVRRGRLLLVRSWGWLFAIAFLAVLVFQIVPLPWAWVERLSPGAAETYRRTLAPAPDARMPLSLHPYGTRLELLRFLSLGMVFFVTVNTVRAKWQAGVLLGALVVSGTFQSLYGFAEQFSGNQHIFWYPRTAHLNAVTGTYPNRNHFAGLLEMALPVSVALLLALLPSRSRRGSVRAKVIETLSSSRILLPMLLVGAAVVMATALMLSLSRAGIVAALASLVLFAACVGLSFGFRRHTIALFALAAAIGLAMTAIGAEVVISRMEDAATGRASSWADRVNLSRSGYEMFREFPAFGSGMGSFRYVFERFQSARFRDRIADYLHNDWLQFAAEAGIFGLVFAVGAMACFLGPSLVAAFRRRDAFCRWGAFGALAGIAALLLHSFFDYNLLKITANALAFAVLAGLAFALSHMPAGKYGSEERLRLAAVPLGPLPARLLLGALAVAGAGAACVWPARAGLADVATNRFLAATGILRPAGSFFLPLDGTSPGQAEELLAKARRFSPADPHLRYVEALWALRQIEESSLERARAIARVILGHEPNASSADVEALAEALAPGTPPKDPEQALDLARQARRKVAAAIARLPVCADYHLLDGETMMVKARLDGSAPLGASALENAAERTAWLSPNKPRFLLGVGLLHVAAYEAADDADERQARLERALARFRGAIEIDPAYATTIYPVAVALLGREGKPYMAVTPPTLAAYQRLARFLNNNGYWEELLACLDEMERLCDRQLTTEDVAPWTLTLTRTDDDPAGDATALDIADTSGATVYETPTLLDIRVQIARTRAAALAMLRRWEERGQAIRQYRTLLREQAAATLEGIGKRPTRRRPEEEILAACRDILERDWGNPQALLMAAEAAAALQKRSIPPHWESALDHLFRLVIYNDNLAPEHVARMRRIVEAARPSSPADRTVAEFVLAAGDILSGNERAGVDRLQALAARGDEGVRIWRQRHLIWYYIGIGLLRLEQKGEAGEAFVRAATIVPRHVASVRALAELEEEGSAPPPPPPRKPEAGEGVGTPSPLPPAPPQGEEEPEAPAAEPPPATWAERLAALTPDVPCNIAFGGKLTLKGFSVDKRPVAVRMRGVDVQDEAWHITYHWVVHERAYAGYQASVQFSDASWTTLFHAGGRLVDGNGTPYPLDFPRSGEAVFHVRRLPQNAAFAVGMQVGVGTLAHKRSEGVRVLLFSDDSRQRVSTEIRLSKLMETAKP